MDTKISNEPEPKLSNRAYYQLTYIIPSSIANLNALEKIIINANKIIADNGGVIVKPLANLEEQIAPDSGKNGEELEKIRKSQNVRISKNRLAYHIKKVSYGFFVSVIYELSNKNQSGAVKKIADEIKLIKEITRFINIKYNYALFTRQAAQKEKSKTIKIPEKAAQKEQEQVKKTKHKEKTREELILDEKPKKNKKTEIDELDKKLEQILNA